MPDFIKSFVRKSVFGIKEASGGQPNAEALAKINQFALSEQTAATVYARKFLMAHNMVDRDNERFSEAILEDFAKTFPGKSFLFAHDRYGNYLPLGLFYDAATQEISPDAYKAMTGEDPRLPDDIKTVKILWAHFYMAKTAENQHVISNIEAGTFRHGSIGFRAADLAPVKNTNGLTLYYQYTGPGEATEGSLVWLGAQQGATTQKQAKHNDGKTLIIGNEGDKSMKSLLAFLGKLTGKTFDENSAEAPVIDAVTAVISEKDTKIKTLEADAEKNAPLIAEGKKYRQMLVDDYSRMKVALKECEEGEAALNKLKGFAGQLPIDFIEAECKALKVRMEEKFPSTGQLNGEKGDNRTDGEEKNELVPED